MPVNLIQPSGWNLVFPLISQLLSTSVDEAGTGLEGNHSPPCNSSEKRGIHASIRSTVRMLSIHLSNLINPDNLYICESSDW